MASFFELFIKGFYGSLFVGIYTAEIKRIFCDLLGISYVTYLTSNLKKQSVKNFMVFHRLTIRKKRSC